MNGLKKRSSNFNHKEESLLISLVRKYKGAIECKQSDRDTNRLKSDAWVKLATEFNSICGETYREPKILRNKYENLKKRSKKKFADEKLYVKGTGGGPSKVVDISNIDTEIKDIIGTQMTGLNSEFDGDREASPINISMDTEEMNSYHLNVEDEQSVIVFENFDTPGTSARNNDEAPQLIVNNREILGVNTGMKIIASNKEITEAVVSSGKNWGKYAPDMLRTPVSTPLRTGSKKQLINKDNVSARSSVLSNKMIEWAANKAEIAKTVQQYMKEEHELKMTLMREHHDRSLEILEWESKERIRILEEESKHRMSSNVHTTQP